MSVHWWGEIKKEEKDPLKKMQKRRVRRLFLLETNDGPLVTSYPTPHSVLDAEFRSANRRVFRVPEDQKRKSTTLTMAPPNSNEGEEDFMVKDVRRRGKHSLGYASVVFAEVKRAPLCFGTGDDEEVATRRKIGVIRVSPCSLCAQNFEMKNLPYFTTQKTILERRAEWGCTELSWLDVKAGNMYARQHVCVFCAQFCGIRREDNKSNDSVVQVVEETGASLREMARAKVRGYVKSMREQFKKEDILREQFKKINNQQEESFRRDLHAIILSSPCDDDGTNRINIKDDIPDNTAPLLSILPHMPLDDVSIKKHRRAPLKSMTGLRSPVGTKTISPTKKMAQSVQEEVFGESVLSMDLSTVDGPLMQPLALERRNSVKKNRRKLR